MYGKGISKSSAILDMAIEFDIVEKAGSWFSYNGEKLGQGRENIKTLMEGDEKLMSEIETKVREKIQEEKESKKDDKKDSNKAVEKDK